MRKRLMQVFSICMAAALTVTSVINADAAEMTGTNFTQNEGVSETEKVISSPVLITEIVPNTENVGELDSYEYYELTNISDKEVDLSNYNVVYINGSKLSVWECDVKRIPAKESIVVWVRNGDNALLTKEDFKSYYAMPDHVEVAEVSCDGLANSKRGLAITTKTGKVLIKADYTSEDSNGAAINKDEAIVFTYVGDEVILKYDQNPSPLTVEADDIIGTYVAPETLETPGVEVTEIESLAKNTDMTITVTDTNLGMDKIVAGKVTIDGTEDYELTLDAENNLSVTVPFAAVAARDTFKYQVSITDGINTAVSTETTVVIEEDEDVKVDQTKAPELTITELLPDSTNVNGSDGYEYIEIYNNTENAINLKDYKLCYIYPETEIVTTYWETEEDKMLEAGETLLFWIKNGSNDHLTLKDFNTFYGTSFAEDQAIELFNGGMSNSSCRGMCIITNVGDVIDSVIYNDSGVDHVNKNLAITYQNQYINGAFTTVMTSDTETPTPGHVSVMEKPVYTKHVIVPEKAPVLADHTMESFSNSLESLEFGIEAVSEETTIKTVKLYYKYNDQETYDFNKLVRTEGNTFTKSLTNIDIINKRSFTYYFEVSDGFTTITTEEKTIVNTDAAEISALNVKDGDCFADLQQIIAYGNQLSIDGADLTEQTTPSINGAGKIAFDATETDVFFKNAVSVGKNVLGVFNEGTYSDTVTYVYDVDACLYDAETKTITVEFHAGNKANVLEHNIENNDDFAISNIRMILPNGKTITPVSYQGKKGLGEVEHPNMDHVPMVDMNVASQATSIAMGDGTSKYEIVYATFRLEEDDFEAVRYMWDTTQVTDGEHTVSNGGKTVTVMVDNTAPVITVNIEDQKTYHNGTIEVSAADAISDEVKTVVTLDGKMISVPYEFRALEMNAGEHLIKITACDAMGNAAEKEITFITPNESPVVDEVVSPEDGSVVTTNPVLSVKAADESGDEMTVTFKEGERYMLGDSNITLHSGVSNKSGAAEDLFEPASGNGFPYDSFDIALDEEVSDDTIIQVKWTGTSNHEKTFMYVYNTSTASWEKVDAEQRLDGEFMVLTGDVALKDHILDGNVKVIVQNGEGYTPQQYVAGQEYVKSRSINITSSEYPTHNVDDTPREEYDFTFAIESDTQYYNEDYDDNPNQGNDGIYQHQLNIHNWLLANRVRMNIQYLFHNGDIIDDEPNLTEWQQADAAYHLLDAAGFPYGVLAGNHDVGHLNGSYDNYTTYFGEERYASNPWYGGSYKNNRGHYDLITVGGIDFIMLYMGWGIGDEEIAWMNTVLAQYPERKAILNFHEYLLASGGLGEEPQRIYDEVVAVNENVCMVLSGHYHNAKTRTDIFTNADGTTRTVYSMLFDYQGLIEGGAGYMRLMHFDLDDERMIIRTYSPSHGGSDLDNYGDYDAKQSDVVNAGNSYVIESANLNDSEHFVVSFAELGITPKAKALETDSLDVNVYSGNVIGSVEAVQSGEMASFEWKEAKEGINGWYAEVTDENGGLTRTNVHYVEVNRAPEVPEHPEEDTTEVVRLYGENRYDTAYAVADVLKETLGAEKFDAVVVATGQNFADALAGSFLASEKSAPILLTNGEEENIAELHDYIKANVAEGGKVYILGGTGAVPEDAEAIEDYEVVRLFGQSRYDTNLEILKEAGVFDETIIVTTGKTFADSLSASAAKLPILLVKPGETLSDAQKDIVKDMKNIYIIGGTGAVSAEVEEELAAYGEVVRIYGKTRYETSVAVAKEFFAAADKAVVASGKNFPDGLCGGPLASAMNAPLILTADAWTDAAAGYMAEEGVTSGYVLGGSGALADETVVDVFELESADDIVLK